MLFLQNHDQVGNRAFGERLTALADPAALEAAIAAQILCPQIPLIFMGEEVASRTPFLFFTDHDAELGEGVRRDGARSSRISPRSPIPRSGRASLTRTTRRRSRRRSRFPIRREAQRRRDLYRRLIEVRMREIAPHIDRARALFAMPLGRRRSRLAGGWLIAAC